MSNRVTIAATLICGIAGLGLAFFSHAYEADGGAHGHGGAPAGHNHAMASSSPSTYGTTMESSAGHDGHTGHNHDRVERIEPGPDAPTLAMTLSPDPVSGWNLHIDVTHFRFAPEHASLEAEPGEGHAHIYVNGTKLARLYGTWFHIGALPEGKNEIVVTLNANDHAALAVGDTPLQAMTHVTVE